MSRPNEHSCRATLSQGSRLSLERLEDRTVPAQLLVMSGSSISYSPSSNLILSDGEYPIVEGSQWYAVSPIPRLVAAGDSSTASIAVQGSLKLKVVPDEGDAPGDLVGIQVSAVGVAFANVIDPESLAGTFAASVKFPGDEEFRDLVPTPGDLWTTTSYVSPTYDGTLATFWYAYFGLAYQWDLSKHNLRIGDEFTFNYSVTCSARPDPVALMWDGTGYGGSAPGLAYFDTQSEGLSQMLAVRVAPAFPDIIVTDATTTDVVNRRKIDVKYEIKDAPSEPFELSVYQSADQYYDEDDKSHFLGKMKITKKSDLSVTKPGKPHKKTLELPSYAPPVNITKELRFIIVVANESGAANELDATNDSMFVIPILRRGFFRANGAFDTQTHTDPVTNHKENDVSFAGAITGMISRGTDDFNVLEQTGNFSDLWRGIELSNGAHGDFPSEQFPPAPYQDDNFLLNPAMTVPLNFFKDLLTTAIKQGRMKSLKALNVTAALNEDGRHQISPEASLHYEGRAVDFIVNGALMSKTMVGLGVLAGFDWADFENNNHLHFAARAEASADGFHATVSAKAMIQTLDWGVTAVGLGGLPLITDNTLYQNLRDLMADVDVGGLTNAEKRDKINSFVTLVSQGVQSGTIRQGFASGRKTDYPSYHYGTDQLSLKKGLLKYNALKLLDEFPI